MKRLEGGDIMETREDSDRSKEGGRCHREHSQDAEGGDRSGQGT